MTRKVALGVTEESFTRAGGFNLRMKVSKPAPFLVQDAVVSFCEHQLIVGPNLDWYNEADAKLMPKAHVLIFRSQHEDQRDPHECLAATALCFNEFTQHLARAAGVSP